jgi:hypothetical protein
MVEEMATRTHVDKNGNSWYWEETPETIEALKQLHETVQKINEGKFAGNYPGPLYAPHPNIKNETKTDTATTNLV